MKRAVILVLTITIFLGHAVAQGTNIEGTLIVLNKDEATVSLIEASSGKVRGLAAVGEGPHEAATTPGGRYAVVCNYGGRVAGSTLSVVDIAAGKTVRTIELKAKDGDKDVVYTRPHGIQFVPGSNRMLVTSETTGKLLVVDFDSGEVLSAIDTGQDASHMVAVEPEGRLAFVANIASGSVSVIDIEAGERVKVIKTGAGAEGIAVHPDGGEVWVTNRSADTVSIIDIAELEVIEEIECGSFPIRVQFTEDGVHALVSCARSGKVAIITTEDRQIVDQVDMGEVALDAGTVETRAITDVGTSPMPIGILMQPGGRYAYIANTRSDLVTLIDLEKWAVVGRLTAGKTPDGMCYSSVGK